MAEKLDPSGNAVKSSTEKGGDRFHSLPSVVSALSPHYTKSINAPGNEKGFTCYQPAKEAGRAKVTRGQPPKTLQGQSKKLMIKLVYEN